MHYLVDTDWAIQYLNEQTGVVKRLQALQQQEGLPARAYAKVIGIPSSHAKYPLGSGAFSLRGYFAWSGV